MDLMRRLYSAVVICFAITVVATCVTMAASHAGVPDSAYRYQRDLIREARAAWGLSAPVATFAAQIHQESGWRADARSAYASGLAQFTPDTARWIAGAYPRELAAGQPLNPAWAIRALVVYDLHLWTGLHAATGCDRMAMALAGYNGGAGWINREKRKTTAAGGDAERWFNQVEAHCIRSEASCRENRDYPRKILTRWQPMYATWGQAINCTGIA